MNTQHRDFIFQVIDNKVPQAYKSFCYELWKEYSFTLRLSSERKSKLGDYRFDPLKNTHQISVNRNLNPWSFLITYTHEVAHMIVTLTYSNDFKHHGMEWKHEFKKLLLQIIQINALPDVLIKPLVNYTKNPKASNFSDPSLTMALSTFDPPGNGTFLISLEKGNEFVFQNNRYRYLEKRRTRILCMRVNSKRRYLISGHAPVTPV